MASRKKKTRKVSETLLLPAPTHIAAGEFKARCLELMDLVDEARAEFVITKRGRPVARLVPVEKRKRVSGWGALKGSFEIIGDIVSPAVPLSDYSFTHE